MTSYLYSTVTLGVGGSLQSQQYRNPKQKEEKEWHGVFIDQLLQTLHILMNTKNIGSPKCRQT